MKNEKLTNREKEALKQIRKHLNYDGRFPSVRKLMDLMGYRSPRSAAVLLEQLVKKGVIERSTNGCMQLSEEFESQDDSSQTINIPLLGSVACGAPMLAEENVEAMIPVCLKLARNPHKYFMLKAQGDSMNLCDINDGDLVLVRQQNTANNGELVVALIDDEATIKQYHNNGSVVILNPKSSNKNHKPIILTQDFNIQGVVVTTIGNLAIE